MKFSNRAIATMAVAAASLVLSACEKAAEGQVAAVVNGEEVTLQEINAVLSSAKVPEGADKKELQKQALKQIVDRRLLAQAAKEDGIDQDPEYLIKQRQLSEALLVQMYADKAGSTIKVPDQQAISRYMSSNPQAFENRTVYALDQIRFAAFAEPEKLKRLEAASSMSEIVALLNDLGVKFQRGNGRLDSASVPPAIMAQIVALDPNEPFVVPQGGTMTASVITAKSVVPLDAAKSSPLAANAIRKEEMGKIMETRLEEAKAKATIEYQDGFEPTDKPSGKDGDGDAATTAAEPATAPALTE